jgi:excisionase family DNA binding protein
VFVSLVAEPAGTLSLVPDEEEWITQAEAARRLGVSVSTIKNLASAGQLTSRRRGRRGGVLSEDVSQLLRASRIQRPPGPADTLS